MNQLKIIFVYDMRQGFKVYYFVSGYPVLPALSVAKILLSPWHTCQKSNGHNCAHCLWFLNSVSLIHTSVFMPEPHRLDYYNFVVSFKF